MHAFEVWEKLSPELNNEILECAYLNEKKLYRRVVDELATNLRKRSKVLLETPRKERHQLFHTLLPLPNFHMLSQNLVINWLGQEQVPMMNAFLDELGIQHDGLGCVDNFPEDVKKAELSKAVDKLYKDFPEEKVSLYLSLFDSISGVEWKELEGLVKKSA